MCCCNDECLKFTCVRWMKVDKKLFCSDNIILNVYNVEPQKLYLFLKCIRNTSISCPILNDILSAIRFDFTICQKI